MINSVTFSEISPASSVPFKLNKIISKKKSGMFGSFPMLSTAKLKRTFKWAFYPYTYQIGHNWTNYSLYYDSYFACGRDNQLISEERSAIWQIRCVTFLCTAPLIYHHTNLFTY